MTTPTGVLFQNPRVKPLSTTGTQQAGCYAYFYLTGTTTQTDVYADGDLTTPLSQPVTADSTGQFVAIYMNPSVTYRVQLYTSGGSLISDTDPYGIPNIGALSQAQLAEILYPQTAAESTAGVTPTNYAYPPLYVDRYGTNTTPGTTDMSGAFSTAFKVATAGGGGRIRYGATAPYATTNPINFTWLTVPQPNMPPVTLVCETGATPSPPVASIIGNHSGHVIDLAGAYGVIFENVSITSGVTSPKSAFFQARNSAKSSVGFTRFVNCSVTGTYTSKPYYNYGAEDDQIYGGYWTNASSAANSGVLQYTANNIDGLTSSFGTIASGSCSCIDHKVFGGEFFMNSGTNTADVIKIEQSDSVKVYGPWLACGNGTTGGRSLVFMDATNAASNFCRFYGVQGENFGGSANPTYGFYFGATAATPSSWLIDGAYLPTSGKAIAAGTGVTLDNFHLKGIAEQVSNGLSVTGTVQNSVIDCAFMVLAIGTSKNNALIGASEQWTITTRSNDNWTDTGTANKTWTPVLASGFTGTPAQTNKRCLLYGNMCRLTVTLTASGGFSCSAGAHITGLPIAAVVSGQVLVTNADTPSSIGVGTVSGSNIVMPSIGNTTADVTITADFFVA